jgi:hypothetical protein
MNGGVRCTQCDSGDQVRSVRAVYEEQTSTYFQSTTGLTSGTAFVRGAAVPTFGRSTFHTSGSISSLLADHLAPPPYPHLVKPNGGCLLAVVSVAPLLSCLLTLPLLASDQAGAGRNAMVFWFATGLPFVLVAAILLVHRIRTQQRNKQHFRQYSAIYPSLSTIWNATFLCQRCHLGFVPAGALGRGEPAAAAVPHFQQMVSSLASELRSRAPSAPTAP